MLVDVFQQRSLQILGVVEKFTNLLECVFEIVDHFLAGLARESFDAAHTGCNAALGDNFEETDVAGTLNMNTATELAAGAEAHYAYFVAVFLTEEGDGTQFLGLLDGGIAEFLQR